MSKTNGKEYRLPSRDISYAYTVAMYFGQQLEFNLKSILYAFDYHDWGTSVELDEAELKRYKNTEGLIDKATCGLILKKLRESGTITSKKTENLFNRACAHRNKLAHDFFTDGDFGEPMTKKKEAEIISDLHEMTLDLYRALLISRAFRKHVEFKADESHKAIQELIAGFGFEHYDNPNRHYSTRKKK